MIHRENLKKMIDFMETIPEEYIKMSKFREADETSIECDSVGCVIGWCTTLDKENIAKNFINDDNVIEFNLWINSFLKLDELKDRQIWLFMFGEIWDDNKEYIINRMKYIHYLSSILEHKKKLPLVEDILGYYEDDIINDEIKKIIG